MLEKIQDLCKLRGITLSGLERELSFSRGAMYKWENNSPSIDKLQKVADYFNVSIDCLLGRTDHDESSNLDHAWATPKDKLDFKKMLEEDDDLMFDGIPIEGEDRQRIKDVLTGLFWEAKQMNKRKEKPGSTNDTKK